MARYGEGRRAETYSRALLQMLIIELDGEGVPTEKQVARAAGIVPSRFGASPTIGVGTLLDLEA